LAQNDLSGGEWISRESSRWGTTRGLTLRQPISQRLAVAGRQIAPGGGELIVDLVGDVAAEPTERLREAGRAHGIEPRRIEIG
jgi:hypothetical protein